MALINDERENNQKDPDNLDNSCKKQLNKDSIPHKTNFQEEQNRSRCYYGVQKYRYFPSKNILEYIINFQIILQGPYLL